MKKRLLSAVIALVPLMLAAPALLWCVEGSFERSLHVTGPVDLQVSTGSGAIHVRAGDSQTVQVRGTIKARDHGSGMSAEDKVRQLESNPPLEQDGNTIRIGHISESELGRNVSISYDLVVPKQTRLRAETGSGDQSVEGIQGPLKAATGSGGIRITRISSEVHAETGSGDIQVESVQGSVTANTGSGSIRANGVAGEFSGETGSGDVRLEQSAPGRVRVSTGSGSIELAGVNGPLRVDTGSGEIKAQGELAGDWRLETGSGEVTVSLPSNAGFDLHAHTDSGRITTTREITLTGTLSRNDYRGKVGSGGYLLDVKTGSGDIRIE
ncbi:MAG TPA: DUF4097 family beta strand repeat-containing protein [Terriglobia bacterium]|nr:DUF4097 family beta strand repeat-containing protein [Terriglobia bacterium]